MCLSPGRHIQALQQMPYRPQPGADAVERPDGMEKLQREGKELRQMGDDKVCLGGNGRRIRR